MNAENQSIKFDEDVAGWIEQQAGYLRALRFDQLDVVQLAKVIEEVAENEKRELNQQVATLLIKLLKWDLEPIARTQSQADSIFAQQRSIEMELMPSPSLKGWMAEPNLQNRMWEMATRAVASETGRAMDVLLDICPWSIEDMWTIGWLPPDAASTHENSKSAVTSITPDISVPFVQKYKALVWSNPQAPVEVFIRRALLRPDFSVFAGCGARVWHSQADAGVANPARRIFTRSAPGSAGDPADACSPGWEVLNVDAST